MAVPIPRVYLLSLFYPSLAKCQLLVEKAKALVEAAAGKEWRVVNVGGQTLAIAFVTDRLPAQLREHFAVLAGHPQFSYLLVQISKFVSGTMQQSVLNWWLGHRPQDYEK